jgi:hypothetical protein
VTAERGPESSSPDQDPQSKALLLSGVGRYADPWHPFAETSAALAGLLRKRVTTSTSPLMWTPPWRAWPSPMTAICRISWWST